MSMMVSFCAVFFPTKCLGWGLELNWVSFWGFSFLLFLCTTAMIQKVLSLKGYFGWTESSREANKTAPKLFPFWKMTGKHEGVPNTVTAITWNKCTVLHVRTANIAYELRSISESRKFARVINRKFVVWCWCLLIGHCPFETPHVMFNDYCRSIVGKVNEKQSRNCVWSNQGYAKTASRIANRPHRKKYLVKLTNT